MFENRGFTINGFCPDYAGVNLALTLTTRRSLPEIEPSMLLKSACVVGVSILLLAERTSASDAVDVAASLIGRPYVWGAEGPRTFDCSGLTQYVFRQFDVKLPRRAVSQSKVGDPIGRRLQRGDLVFFGDDERKALVTHVGIYEGRGHMIEASKRAGRVRRSNLNEAFWADRFMFARRVTGDMHIAGGGAEDEVPVPSSRKRDVRRATVRALEEVVGALLRRARR